MAKYEYETVETIDSPYFQLLRKKKPLIARLLWLLTTIGLFVFCTWIVFLLLRDYLSNPSYNEMTSKFVENVTLPAITICNMNALNATALKAKEVKYGNYTTTLYKAYLELVTQYEHGSTDTGSNGTLYEKINTENVHRYYSMAMKRQFLNYNKFSKFQISLAILYQKGQFVSTEYGTCFELNDSEELVQQVSGPVGGLEIYLDTMIDDYVSSVQSEGYQIFLRMPNETVQNTGFGFSVKPGEHTSVNLHKTTVTRLPSPYGTCTNTPSLYNPNVQTTIKECYMTNILWYFLRDEKCKCWPWYFEDRFMEDKQQWTQIIEHGSTVEDRLIQYWTTTVSAEYRLNISTNETCKKEFLFNGTYIKTITNIVSFDECATTCRGVKNCVGFDYNSNYTTSTNYGVIGSCNLYDSTVMVGGNTTLDGLDNGMVNCSESFSECSVSVYEICANRMIQQQMKGNSSELCTEPCTYIDYTYDLSTTTFPSKNAWNETFSEDSDYKSWDDARKNLVRITLYYETLIENYNAQTASYEIQNFIAELGGLIDLLVGLSFFTVFQLVEWGFVRLLGLARKAKEEEEEEEEEEDDEKNIEMKAGNIMMNNIDPERSDVI